MPRRRIPASRITGVELCLLLGGLRCGCGLRCGGFLSGLLVSGLLVGGLLVLDAVIHDLDRLLQLALLVGVGLRVGHVLLVVDLLGGVYGLLQAVAGGVVRHLAVRVGQRLACRVQRALQIGLGGVEVFGGLGVGDDFHSVLKSSNLRINLHRIALNTLPCGLNLP